MNNSDEELNIINTVLGFCESGDTHLEPETMLNPVTHYTDPDRLNQEIETLFRKFPIIVGHAGQLKDAGRSSRITIPAYLFSLRATKQVKLMPS